MSSLDFSIMEHTVLLKEDSTHRKNPIAASVFSYFNDKSPFQITRTNYFPERLFNAFGDEQKIGNASPSVHAETAILSEIAMIQGMTSDGAKLYVTDPTCVNCAKNIIEAGIAAVYIDSTGFEGDFYQRRCDDFDNMALSLYRASGVKVYKVDRAAQHIEELIPDLDISLKPKFSDAVLSPYQGHSEHDFKEAVSALLKSGGSAKRQMFALVSGGTSSKPLILTTGKRLFKQEHLNPCDYVSKKYTNKLEPFHKATMVQARLGLTPHRDFLASAYVPTARELVDIVGAGYERLFIIDRAKARDEEGLRALQQLEDHKILEVVPVGMTV